jgi:CDP-diacylglycerol---glycerol-3-phosphate 3-phosphatidyltransferase
MKRYIPNLLTIIRFFLIPFFLYYAIFSSSNSAILWATIIFIIASITDYLDGLLARKFNAITNFGKIMDPLADKILVLSALLALSIKFQLIPEWLLYLILFREVMVSIFREYFANKKIFIAANIWGKVKTFMQMIGIVFALIYLTGVYLFQIGPLNPLVNNLFLIYFIIVAVITWVSGLLYFALILKMRKD